MRSYSAMVENLHKNIYKVETYDVSERVRELEKDIYRIYGAFSE